VIPDCSYYTVTTQIWEQEVRAAYHVFEPLASVPHASASGQLSEIYYNHANSVLCGDVGRPFVIRNNTVTN